MRKLFVVLVVLLVVITAASCRKTSFIQSSDALVNTSADTLHFDTVFTTTGSITEAFKIFNLNDEKLLLSSVQLMGGSSSAFKINVDGSPGVAFNNIEIAPNDSIYIFVSVSINPTAVNLPFLVRDSISIDYNGINKMVQLDAFGRNAKFLRNYHVKKDEVWTNALPVVILGGLTVDSAINLTIQKGCAVYAHADAPIIVNGTLKVDGDKYDSTRVVFKGDRLDDPYKDFPGSWPGILFSSSSKDNVLSYATIKNAYQGIIAELPSVNGNPKVTLNQCILDNIYDGGIIAVASSVNATNCLITNCGSNIEVALGGNYNFTHCTVASFGNNYIAHKQPVLYLTNANDQNQVYDLNAQFKNCIFYGQGGTVDNEIVVDKKGTSIFNVSFSNTIYKVKDDPSNATFTNCIKNQLPQFDSVSVGDKLYNLHLQSTSPAINKGIATGVTIDLDGKARDTKPDIGCYEY